MKRTVDVGPRVRDHLDFANLELGTGRILCSRCLTTEPVTDDRRRESFIRDHAVLDGVTDIDQPLRHQLLAGPRTRTGVLWFPARSTTDTHTSTGAAASAVGAVTVHCRTVIGTISVRHAPVGHFDCTTQTASDSPRDVSATSARFPRTLSVAVGAGSGTASSQGMAGISAGCE